MLVQIAGVFEFSGALLLGRVSTNTIAGGIADITAFTANPEVYAYGMVCALTVGTIWQILSSYMGLNTSATHTISEHISYSRIPVLQETFTANAAAPVNTILDDSDCCCCW